MKFISDIAPVVNNTFTCKVWHIEQFQYMSIVLHAALGVFGGELLASVENVVRRTDMGTF